MSRRGPRGTGRPVTCPGATELRCGRFHAVGTADRPITWFWVGCCKINLSGRSSGKGRSRGLIWRSWVLACACFPASQAIYRVRQPGGPRQSGTGHHRPPRRPRQERRLPRYPMASRRHPRAPTSDPVGSAVHAVTAPPPPAYRQDKAAARPQVPSGAITARRHDSPGQARATAHDQSGPAHNSHRVSQRPEDLAPTKSRVRHQLMARPGRWLGAE